MIVQGGGGTATALKQDVVEEMEAELGALDWTPAPTATAADKRSQARMKGYTGEACSECGNFTLVRNGTCLKCDTCGGTTGCS
jgi:ribonucleoside-diphosphate reductase alpha chain